MKNIQNLNDGSKIYDLVKELFPICRSITGNGVRETLEILNQYIGDLNIQEVPTGTEVFDWTVPKEWNIEDAYIEDEFGQKIISFSDSNLHVMGYSMPMDEWMSLEELKKIIYTQPEQPDVVPYVTSYYRERSGFCMSEYQKNSLKDGKYHAVIKSTLTEGSLTYAELIIPGETEEEIFISTYICHPSMANNECSGPAVSAFLINWVRSHKRRYTYRFVFIPETIGSITYLSRNYKHLKEKVIAGFNLSCVGDDRMYSYVQTRYGNTLTDRILENTLSGMGVKYKAYSYLHRGSDERQYNAPGIDLPVCGVCRTKYGAYMEYHTSADDLSLVSPEGLYGAYDMMRKVISVLEYNEYYKIKCFCEPQLGKRGLYPTVSQKGSYDGVKIMTDFIAYADGKNDLIGISNIILVPAYKLIPIVEKLLANNLLEKQFVK